MSFVVTVNAVDRTEEIDFGSLFITDNLNQQVDTLQFSTKRYGTKTFVPVIGDAVEVTRNATTIFGGVVVRVTEELSSAKIITYKVECNDYSQYLKRRLVTERYEAMTAAAIIEDIIDNYTDEAFTYTNVTAPIVLQSISFNRLSVADALQKLADALSYVWYVDADMDIHFFPKNTEMAPFGLSDTSNNYIYNSLQIVEDLTQIRNSVLVQGGEVVSASARTELFSGDGSRVQFALANKYDSVPTVEVASVAQTVGIEYLDDDASFDCMWNFNEKYLRFTAGNTPTSGTNNIEVSGTYLYPIVVTVPAPSSQEIYGVYQFAITDKSIRSQNEAVARAFAELQSYQNALYEGGFRTYNDGLHSGQVITIASDQRERSLDVLIQSVTARMRDPQGDVLEYHVKFATLKSIGIIDYLQNQLRSKEVLVDDQETLLNYFPLADSAGFSDSLATPTASTGPYNWNDSQNWGYAVFG